MKIFKEIFKIGLIDWCWFVLYLKRDKYNKKLSITRYYPKLKKYYRDSKRVEEIYLLLRNIY